MAAALLRRLVGGKVEVQSAGTDAGNGLPPTKESVSVMKELGIDIGAHRSRDIADLDLTEFDLVLALTPSIAEDLRNLGADPARIKQLKVADPYGKGIDVYRSTAAEIEHQLSSLLRTGEGGLCLQ